MFSSTFQDPSDHLFENRENARSYPFPHFSGNGTIHPTAYTPSSIECANLAILWPSTERGFFLMWPLPIDWCLKHILFSCCSNTTYGQHLFGSLQHTGMLNWYLLSPSGTVALQNFRCQTSFQLLFPHHGVELLISVLRIGSVSHDSSRSSPNSTGDSVVYRCSRIVSIG